MKTLSLFLNLPPISLPTCMKQQTCAPSFHSYRICHRWRRKIFFYVNLLLLIENSFSGLSVFVWHDLIFEVDMISSESKVNFRQQLGILIFLDFENLINWRGWFVLLKRRHLPQIPSDHGGMLKA